LGGVAGFAKDSAAVRPVFDGQATMNAWFVVAGQPASPKWKTFLIGYSPGWVRRKKERWFLE
jgi:hypothetical protein